MNQKLLICEGRCNPHFEDVQQEVRAFRAGEGSYGGDGYQPVAEPIAKRLRSLRHTLHVETANYHFRCVDCGRSRRFGVGQGIGLLRVSDAA